MNRVIVLWLLIYGSVGLGMGCRVKPRKGEGTPVVIATTTIVADLVRQIGSPVVQVSALMGPGIDPHLYKASGGDVARMQSAAMVFYNGLHLEGKMSEIFERMEQLGKPTVAVADCIPDSLLLEAPGFGGVYDPHVWMDVSLWSYTVSCVQEALSAVFPAYDSLFVRNGERYKAQLEQLHQEVLQKALEVPEARRVLVTSHDAFRYFGRAYTFEVRGLLGISTASEAGTADVRKLADFIVARQIPAVFIESSVPARYLEALKEAVESQGFALRVAGPLYSDALGDPGTPEGTYPGMIRYNIQTIVEALR